jgi:hypothetical protein
MAKKPSKDKLIKCRHCELEFDFPADYCKVCDQHCHTIFMGLEDNPAHPNVCNQCWHGLSPKGNAWRRANQAWAPNNKLEEAWDLPEWYDSYESWRNETLEPLWIETNNDLQEIRHD